MKQKPGVRNVQDRYNDKRKAMLEFRRRREADGLFTLGERSTTSDYFRSAIEAHRAALTEYDRATVPLDWALGNANLGAALMRLGEREKDADLLDQAISAYNDALKEFTRERTPDRWATIQFNIRVLRTNPNDQTRMTNECPMTQ